MPYDGFDIADKITLITGGTSGLGRAIALGFAQAGARVFAGSRDAGKIADTQAALNEIDDQEKALAADVADAENLGGMQTRLNVHGRGHEALSLDVANPESVNAVAEHVREKAGQIDVWINAAGITFRKPTLEVELKDWQRVIDINLTGTFLCCQSAGRIMKEQGGGAIINIASLSSYVGLPEVPAYGASKAGVMQLTQTLAVEWARYGIRVNAIAPGVFPTPLNRHLIEGTPRGEWFKAHTPMKRFGNPPELVGAAIFLASPSASYVTGEILTVDGGFLALGVPGELPTA